MRSMIANALYTIIVSVPVGVPAGAQYSLYTYNEKYREN